MDPGRLSAGYVLSMRDPASDRPETRSLDEIEERLGQLDADYAQAIRAKLVPAPLEPPPGYATAPDPIYKSWQQYLDATTLTERRAWCSRKARRSNRERLMSGPVDYRLTVEDVLLVLTAAEGWCVYCGSLALENRPSRPDGSPAPWEHVGRRIGSLGHRVARVNGGSNSPENLDWVCLWCNVWVSERRTGATDHGGIR